MNSVPKSKKMLNKRTWWRTQRIESETTWKQERDANRKKRNTKGPIGSPFPLWGGIKTKGRKAQRRGKKIFKWRGVPKKKKNAHT